MTANNIAADGKWKMFLSCDRGGADTGIRTTDGALFDVSYCKAGGEHVTIATGVDYDDARAAAKRALAVRRAERAKELIARYPAAIIDLDYSWVRSV